MKRLSLLYMMLFMSVLQARDWHANYKGYRHVWYNDDYEKIHTTFATYDTACVKFDTTNGEWIISILDTNGVVSFRVDGSLSQPLIERTTSNSKNIRTPNVYEGWVTHEAATDTVTLGVVPTNYFVSQVFVWVQEAFNSDGADNLIIGYDADDNAYATTIDVSGTGVKSVTLGTSGRIVDATSRTIKAYYDDAGSDATTGEAHIYIEWIQATVNP